MTTPDKKKARPSAKPASTSTEASNPTSCNQKGTPMSTSTTTANYHDELGLIQNGRLVITPSSLEDLRSRPNATELLDLNGDTEAVVRKIVDREGRDDDENHRRWCVEETHWLATDGHPATTGYSINVRADGLSVDQLRGYLTTILALLPADAETYTAALTAQSE